MVFILGESVKNYFFPRGIYAIQFSERRQLDVTSFSQQITNLQLIENTRKARKARRSNRQIIPWFLLKKLEYVTEQSIEFQNVTSFASNTFVLK